MDFHAKTMLDMRHLQQAAQTLARLPSDGFTKPAGMRSPWPEMIRGNYIVIAGTRRNSQCQPPPQQIDEMDIVLDCLTDFPAPARRLLWARACRVRWQKLEIMTGRSRSSLHRDLQRALRQFQAIWQRRKNHLDK